MFYVSEIQNVAPKEFKSNLQELTYQILDELAIAYERVTTDEAITMNDCLMINERLDVDMVKTLFLSDSNREKFFIFITKAHKKFKPALFKQHFNQDKLMLAPKELMLPILKTKIGAATIFSAAIDHKQEIKIVIDKEVMESDYFGCSDGTNYGFMKIKTKDILDKFVPYTKHEIFIIED